MEKQTREMLMEENVTDLKDYFKNADVRPPAGYWKMTKDDMIEEIIKYQEQEKGEIKMEENKVHAAETELEVVKEEEVKPVKPVKTDAKYIFKAIDPDGVTKFESEKLNDVVEYSMENGIASRGWVALSIKRNIPVLIGLGRDQEVPEDFEPRTTAKYSGNYWKFTKEEVKPS